MNTTYVGLGSNLGDRLAFLRAAVRDLDATPRVSVARVSSVYETDPVGPPQPNFLNAAAELATSLEPAELLATLKVIERRLGRVGRERWGPREIDLDLLLYGDLVLDEPGLRVPHPELVNRAFVLVPLAEIAPNAVVPGAGCVGELAARIGSAGVLQAGPLARHEQMF